MVGTQGLAELPTRAKAQDEAAAPEGESESGPGVRVTLHLVSGEDQGVCSVIRLRKGAEETRTPGCRCGLPYLSAPLSSGTGDPQASEDLLGPPCASAETGFRAGPPWPSRKAGLSRALTFLSGSAPTGDRVTVEGPAERRCER